MAVPYREGFLFIPDWMQLVMYVALALSALSFLYLFHLRLRAYRLSGHYRELIGLAKRNLGSLIREGLLQRRVRKVGYVGVMHSGILYGAIALFLGSVIVFIDYVGRRALGLTLLQGSPYVVLKAALDSFGLLFLFGVILAFVRRIAMKPPLQGGGRKELTVLIALLYIAVTGFLLEGLRQYIEPTVEGGGSPFLAPSVSSIFLKLGLPGFQAVPLYQMLWLSHALVTFAIMASAPMTGLFHIVLSPLNLLTRPQGGPGRPSTPFRLADLLGGERAPERWGMADSRDIGWQQRISLDSCTGCGRCEQACPAILVGRDLSPRGLILKLNRRVHEDFGEDEVRSLFEGPLKEREEVWSCTTCAACLDSCPSLIDHVGLVLELRRHLVSTNRLDERQRFMLSSLMTHSNPFGAPSLDRDEWVKRLGARTLKEEPDAEYLYWLGCAAFFDARAREVATSIMRILRRGGVKFAVLGREERCTGDPARRLGEEGLFQQMALENIGILKGLGVRKIITHCPHCYDTLKNEYGEFGGDFQVYHHTQIIKKLMDEGRLQATGELRDTVTIHDSCYLGRYNRVYDEPRQIVGAIKGLEMREMKRARERSLCCGAGGANYWYRVPEREGMARVRVREARERGAGLVAVECPFCLSMLEDAVKAEGLDGTIKVKDIAEVIEEVSRA